MMQLFTNSKKFEVETKDGFGVITGYIPYYDASNPGTDYAFSDTEHIRFAPGSFSVSLASDQPVNVYYNHDSSAIVASTRNGTLKLTDFPNFLRYQATLNLNDTDAARLYSKIKDGLVEGTSFGGNIAESEWSNEKRYDVNLVKQFSLREVSPTGDPAFTASKIRASADESMKLELQASKQAWKSAECDRRYNEIKAKYAK